jgi:DNA modification methylase
VSVRILIGDARERLRELPDASVHCCVTSPPYFGLRDYGCDGQIGLEPTPDEFVAGMVGLFREVRRALRDDGTLWLNLGDSYAGGGGFSPDSPSNQPEAQKARGTSQNRGSVRGAIKPGNGIKPKDLIGIPWRVAFALQADGWWLRQDIIWSKPNPMPESVRDRCTKAHEHIFLLSKSPRYYFDADAISERVAQPGVVERANGANKVAALSNNFGLEVSPPMLPGAAPLVGAADGRRIFKVSVRLASAILDLAQPQDDFSLLSLDPQVRQQRAQEIAGSLIGDHPIIRCAAPQASRFADGDIPAEQFLHELHGLWIALPDGDQLKEAWRFAFLHVGHIDRNGDGAVGVNDARDVGEISVFHAAKHTLSCAPLRKKKSGDYGNGAGRNDGDRHPSGGWTGAETRNKRSVWEVATQPFSEAHFATYPPALIEPCILAGCPKGGTVLDPFFGAGTTGLVADRLGRDCIGIELNPEYAALAERRIQGDAGMFAEVEAA